MGLKDDLRRFEEIGEENREDLEDFMEQYDLRPDGDDISVPVTVIDLPEFVYAKRQEGGIGQGDGAEEGDPVRPPEEEGEGDEAGEEPGDHSYYDMDPEEFADELDEEWNLDLDPKGKSVTEEVEGDFTDTSRTGPNSTLDLDYLYKEGLKRTLASSFDEEYVRELMCVDGMGPESVFEWCRNHSIAVSRDWIDAEYETIEDRTKYDAVSDIEKELERNPPMAALDGVSIRPDDERYMYPEIEEKKEKNVVIVNIRDVSGSMRGTEQKLVEQMMTPLDWYLQGKYDNAEFVYIAHDSEAWECERDEFFGIRSGGGTMVSPAYELALEILEDRYPFSEWNRYVFGAGDGGNLARDTRDHIPDAVNAIDANMHAYFEVGVDSHTDLSKTMVNEVEDQDVVAVTVPDFESVPDRVKSVLEMASKASQQEDS